MATGILTSEFSDCFCYLWMVGWGGEENAEVSKQSLTGARAKLRYLLKAAFEFEIEFLGVRRLSGN